MTIHEAGPLVDGVQACRRCGKALAPSKWYLSFPLGQSVALVNGQMRPVQPPPTCSA